MSAIQDLCQTVAALRDPKTGCPWDIEQTHQSLAKCLIDECSELLETIDANDLPHMREELGDVLLQVVMHAQIEAEKQNFTFEDVADDINAKLIRRHPHVFGEAAKLGNSGAVIKLWDEIKAAEKRNGPPVEGPFKHLPPQLPALNFANEIDKQIEKKRIDHGGELCDEAINDLARSLTEAGAGRLLFETAAACRRAGIDPENALRRETTRLRDAITAHWQAEQPIETP